MSETLQQLAVEDYEELVDFLNLVFSQIEPTDFEHFVPKLYRPTAQAMACNYAIRSRGRIRAVVGLFPITLHLGSQPLRVAGIGGVSTHPRERGRGLMRRLLGVCLQRAVEDGYDLSWLGGQRQRYGHFGYEVCGSTWEFEFGQRNLRHAAPEAPSVRFERVRDPADPRLEAVSRWHRQQPIHCDRPMADWLAIAETWDHELLLARDGDDVPAPAAYLIVDREAGVVLEAGAQSPELFGRVIAGWLRQQHKARLSFRTAPLPSPLSDALLRSGESWSIRPSFNWRVFDWPRTVGALLQLQHRLLALEEGEEIIAVDGVGVLRLWVSGAQAGCEAVSGRPGWRCDAATAMRALFGPLTALAAGVPRSSRLHGWCPLPLHMPRQDEV